MRAFDPAGDPRLGVSQPKRRACRATLYAPALRKHVLAERLKPDEARELRRRRLSDGTYPLPSPTDRHRRLSFQHFDPRLV